jgi:hypothetical protein
LIKANAGNEAAANLEEQRAPSDGLDAISPSEMSGVGNDDRITGLDEAVRFDHDVLKRFEEVAVVADHHFQALVDARLQPPRRRPVELDLWVVQRAEA